MELLVMTHGSDDPVRYSDGDIVCSFTQNKCLYENARRIIEQIEPNIVTGYYDDNLLKLFLEYTTTYKYVKVRGDVRRIRNVDREERLLSTTLAETGITLTSEELDNISKDKYVFNENGQEVWYSEFSGHKRIKNLWEKFEEHSDNRAVDNKNWPLTEAERRQFLPISACHIVKAHGQDVHIECNNATATEKVQPVYLDKKMLARRRFFVPYWDLDSINTEDARDASKDYDARNLIQNEHDDCSVDDSCVCKVQKGLV